MSLRWHDRRLLFTDLNNRTNLNLLTPLQNQLIWKPRLMYINALGSATDDDFLKGSTLALIKQSVEIDYDGALTLTLSRESRLFSGSENSLELSKKITQNYPCQFNLKFYPFDTQVLIDNTNGRYAVVVTYTIFVCFLQVCKLMFKVTSGRGEEHIDLMKDDRDITLDGNEILVSFLRPRMT